MINVALTHDIDRTKKTYQYFSQGLFKFMKFDIHGLKYQVTSIFKENPYWQFDEFMKIEDGFGIRSTVFFLSESIKFNLFKPQTFKLSVGRYNINETKIVKIINELDKNGWEIGVHGSYNSYKDKELLKREKKLIEAVVGHEVIGIRQHYLNLNDNTWKYQKNIGFKYDSSFGLKRNIGFKNSKFLPFSPFNDDYYFVFPLVIMDSNFMRQADRWNKLDNLIAICEEKGSILVVNFHQRVFNALEFPNYKDAYIKIIDVCRRHKARFLTLAEFYSNLNVGE